MLEQITKYRPRMGEEGGGVGSETESRESGLLNDLFVTTCPCQFYTLVSKL